MKELPILPFQKEVPQRIAKFKHVCLLADDMGLGKSLSSLYYIHKNPDIKRTLIVCPAILKSHWRREAKNYFGFPSIILGGRTPYRIIYDAKIWIINYDVFADWLPELQTYKFDLLLMDECHYLCNPDTKRFKAMNAFAHKVKRRLALSGTPITNRHGDLWAILHLLKPEKYPSRFAFGLKYCTPRKERGKWTYPGSVRGKSLHKRLVNTVMIRRTKKEVLKDLPPKTREIIPFSIDRTEYEMAEGDFRKWFKTYNKNNPGAKIDFRTQLGYLIRIAAKAKLSCVQDWIDNFLTSSGEKLIMFGINRNILGPLHQHFSNISVLVNGETPEKKRQMCFDRFNMDKDCRLFLGNIQAAGAGWSSKKCANISFCQFAWKPGLHTQCEDRGLGLGRGGGMPLQSYYLVAENTVEEDLCELLQKKAKLIDVALDYGKETVGEFNIFDKLCQILERKWK